MLAIITDAKQQNGKFEYLVQFKNTSDPESIDSEKMDRFWPQELIKFFEKRILWKRMVQFGGNEELPKHDEDAFEPSNIPVAITCKW